MDPETVIDAVAQNIAGDLGVHFDSGKGWPTATGLAPCLKCASGSHRSPFLVCVPAAEGKSCVGCAIENKACAQVSAPIHLRRQR